MARTISKGICAFCGQAFAKNAIAKHLAKCEQRMAADQTAGKAAKSKMPTEVDLLHLAVYDTYSPDYWLHIEVPADATLKQLDTFLRDTWLECCCHLSAFTIGAQRYTVLPKYDEFGRSMNIKIGKVFHPETVARHEYDFGTTTELTLKVVGQRKGFHEKQPVTLLARNEAPNILCQVCGKPATEVCPVCNWEGAWLCDEHAKTHECGEEMLLPVVNSPRVGQCGYAGDTPACMD